MRIDRLSRRGLAIACVILAVSNLDSSAHGQNASIVKLAPLTEATPPVPYGISSDGSTAFGDSDSDGHGRLPIRWNAAGEPTELLLHDEGLSALAKATATSAEGSVVVGSYDVDGRSFGFRWPVEGPAIQLETFEAEGPGYTVGVADVSADGTVLCGSKTNGASFARRAIFWDADGDATALAHDGGTSGGYEYASADVLSANGAFVGGTFQAFDENGVGLGSRPARWNIATGQFERLATFGEDASGVTLGQVVALSNDGLLAFGVAQKYDAGAFAGQLATRWDADGVPLHVGLGEPTYDLGDGTLGPAEEYVVGCSADGKIAAGYGWVEFSSYQRGFVWTETGGAVALPTLAPLGPEGELQGSTAPRAISADGRTIVGFSTPGPDGVAHGGAFLWHDGEFGSLWDALVAAGCDPATRGWSSLDDATFCSADGEVVVGTGMRDDVGFAAYRVAFDRNEPPTIEGPSDLPTDEPIVVRLGQSFDASFAGDDPDGDDLTLNVTGLPPSATVDPISGTTDASPIDATIDYVPNEDDVRPEPYEVTISVTDESGEEASIAFRIQTPANRLPTVTPPAPVSVECEGDVNLVNLAATVGDADSHQRLAVTWSVGDEEALTIENVVPGSTIDFEHDYADGESDVTIAVTDGYDEASAGTTVTVVDTTAPSIVVAEDVVVATDEDESFATGVALTPPEVFDLCDGEPTLSNDAPDRFPLGETIVRWTATDADDNRASGDQKVTVEDRQAPTIFGVDDVEVSVDPGEIFATPHLPEPDAFDNVPEGLAIEDDAPARFPIGTTRVTWTATDAAGNDARTSLRVTVVNAPPVADAGANVVIEAPTEQGIEVALDGRASSDPDGHSLKYAWSAPGIHFDDPTKKRPTATFPVGETKVTLIVADEAGLAEQASVTVEVAFDDGPTPPGPKPAPRRFVIDGRGYAPGAGYYVDEAVWRCGALPAIESSNVYLLYAAYMAQYADWFDAYAAAVDYRGDGEYDAALDDYLGWRNAQTQYAYATTSYLYYGLVTTAGPAYVYYDYVGAAYSAAYYAVVYGAADYQAK